MPIPIDSILIQMYNKWTRCDKLVTPLSFKWNSLIEMTKARGTVDEEIGRAREREESERRTSSANEALKLIINNSLIKTNTNHGGKQKKLSSKGKKKYGTITTHPMAMKIENDIDS